jgi:hypothetical protein
MRFETIADSIVSVDLEDRAQRADLPDDYPHIKTATGGFQQWSSGCTAEHP